MIKSTSELRKDLKAIKGLVETSNPDANMAENRFYLFLSDVLTHLAQYEPPEPVQSFSYEYTNEFR